MNTSPSFLKPVPQLLSDTPVTPVEAGFRTAAATQGSVDDRMSKQWANRPDDERFLSLGSLLESVGSRKERSRQILAESSHIGVTVVDDDIRLNIDDHKDLRLTNYSFTQLAGQTQIPLPFARRISDNPELLAQVINDGVARASNESINALITAQEDSNQIRAITSSTYGRVWDEAVVQQVMRIAGNGVGDTDWKIPGAIDWSTSNGTTVHYNPFVDITKETTTLYASDRDVYMFLVDDTRPIEIGKLPNGEPDLLFRGFAVWNSETGSGTLGMCTMLLRGVCCNRNIWGVEGQTELKIKHSKAAPERLHKEAFPMLAAYTHSPSAGIVAKAAKAKSTIIARSYEDQLDFLTGKKVGLGPVMANQVIDTVMQEEQQPMASVWDAVQGLTAVARKIPYQDTRLDLEYKAGKLMAKLV